MNPWRSMIVAITLLLGAALATAWPAGPVAAADDVPLADRLFRVEWTAGASGQGQTRIIGYVYNESDHDATNVQLRISALDASIQRVLGRRPELIASPGTYDHKHVTRIAGVPHCVAYGPGELEIAHQPDEFCRVDDLVNATKVIALATLDLMNS